MLSDRGSRNLLHWLKYYRASAASLFLLFSGACVAFGLLMLSDTSDVAIELKSAAAVVLLVSIVPYVFWVENWPCPNCGKRFFRKGIRYIAGNTCVHCGHKMATFPEPPLVFLFKNRHLLRGASPKDRK